MDNVIYLIELTLGYIHFFITELFAGDIADADMKPPENVLFVCKLNPVTSSDDLEIIFSRFGTIE